MNDNVSLVAVLIVAAIGIPIVLLLGAVLIRAAVQLYNRFVGGSESPRAVAVPSLQKAMGIALLIAVGNLAISMGVEQVVSLTGAEWLATTELATDGPSLVVEFVPSFILEFIMMAVVLAYLLPTRFSRALGVSACHTGICIAVAAVAIGAGLAGAALIQQFV
ncbi:MAG: hypothetical protein JNG89_02400 [Planctomycetaceae bacterium]|nr:hypothetical protein [Planctomycetaceae bacterium]